MIDFFKELWDILNGPHPELASKTNIEFVWYEGVVDDEVKRRFIKNGILLGLEPVLKGVTKIRVLDAMASRKYLLDLAGCSFVDFDNMQKELETPENLRILESVNQTHPGYGWVYQGDKHFFVRLEGDSSSHLYSVLITADWKNRIKGSQVYVTDYPVLSDKHVFKSFYREREKLNGS